VTPPEALATYLPVLSAQNDPMAVAQGNAQDLSREQRASPDRVLSGELLTGQRGNLEAPSLGHTRSLSIVPMTVAPPARAVAAYSENVAAPLMVLPRIDLRI